MTSNQSRQPYFSLSHFHILCFINPNYKCYQIQFFGRGNIAGVDIKAQRKETFYGKLLEERRTQAEKDQEE